MIDGTITPALAQARTQPKIVRGGGGADRSLEGHVFLRACQYQFQREPACQKGHFLQNYSGHRPRGTLCPPPPPHHTRALLFDHSGPAAG